MQKKPTKKKRTQSSKSKQRTKKLRTYHESNCSLLDQGVGTGEMSQLFKNEGIKKKQTPVNNGSQINFNSTINNYTSVYTVISGVNPLKPQKAKSSKNINANKPSVLQKKKAPQKQKSKCKLGGEGKQVKKRKQGYKQKQRQGKGDKLQQYQMIPQSKNSLNSEIVFSTQQTSREQFEKMRQESSRIQESLTRITQNSLINNNKMLRSTIKQEFKRKNEAATKIQKVFRGYLTRKILQKYIKQEQQKLYMLLAGYKSSSREQQSQRSQKQSEYEFFSEKLSGTSKQSPKRSSARNQSPKTFQDEQSINLSKINPSQYKFNQDDSKASSMHSNRFFNNTNKNHQIVNCQQQLLSSSQYDEDMCQNQNEKQQYEDEGEGEENVSESEGESECSSDDVIAYRHHEVIYDGSQIQQYLQSSQDEDNNQNNPQHNKQKHHKHINQDQDQIIFQTNQEHIESRKNSLLNKSNQPKIKKSHSTLLDVNEPSQIIFMEEEEGLELEDIQGNNRKYQQDPDLIKTSKVNSINNQSNKSSQNKEELSQYKEQLSVKERKQSKEIQFFNKQPQGEKTSKKQCKRAALPMKVPNLNLNLNLNLNMSQSDELSQSQRKVKQIKVEVRQGEEHLQLTQMIKSGQKYQPRDVAFKKVFMDTISYNSQFKARHQIETVSEEKLSEKKKQSLLKKKIYYFEDSSQHQLQYHTQKELSTPSNKSRGRKNINMTSKQLERLTSKQLERLTSKQLERLTSKQLERLKKSQLQRWDEVIRLITNQLGDSTHQGRSSQFQGFVKQVMQLSLKNKEMLKDMTNEDNSRVKSQQNSRVNSEHSSRVKSQQNSRVNSEHNSRVKSQQRCLFTNSRIDEMLGQKQQEQQQKEEKWKHFKDTLSSGRRKSITQQDIAVFRPHSRAILSSKTHNHQKQPQPNIPHTVTGGPSFFNQPKNQLKQKINKLQLQNLKHIQDSRVKEFTLLNSIQNDQIQQMLKVREEMLEKRQCQQLTRLNEKIIRKQFTQKEFLKQLTALTETFQCEKQSIDKAREDITKGYDAAVKLIKEAFCDAKKVGYKMPLSKSSDFCKLNKNLGFGVFSGLNKVIIDELNTREELFAMKHVKSTQNQMKSHQKTHEKPQQKMEINKNLQQQRSKDNIEQKKLIVLQKLVVLQKVGISRVSSINEIHQPIDNLKPSLTEGSKLQGNVIFNISNTFSQSSQSIINNLSSSYDRNFTNHYFDPQQSPKHQAIAETTQSQLRSIFPEGVSDNFDDFGTLSEQSSQVQFSQQQLRRFRKAQPYDASIADMNKNLMIGREFIQMQSNYYQNTHQHISNEYSVDSQHLNYSSAQKPQDYCDQQRHSNYSQTQNLRMRLYREVYQIQQSQHQNNKPLDPKIQMITEKQLQFLLFEVACQMLMKPIFSEKLLFYKRQQMFGIKRVSDQSRKHFLHIVEEMLPHSEDLFHKVNQNISPLPKQLLKCMRIDFSQDDEDQNQQQYEEIGKYQMILDQDLCTNAIEKYHQTLIQDKQNRQQLALLTGDNLQLLKQQFKGLSTQQWDDKAFAYLEQRQKFVTNRKEHCQSIRWQFINMQLHCLFDAWNQQIIQLKNNRSGFSGIGLNQLTISMVDKNKKIKQQEIDEMMELSKFKLMKMLNYEDQIIEEINQKICLLHKEKESANSIEESRSRSKSRASFESNKSLTMQLKETQQKYSWVYAPNKEVDEEVDMEQEAKWIYYSDEALSYGLQLVYLIEEQLFAELSKDLRKIAIKGHFY